MSLTRMVDGVSVALSAQEEAATLAEWTANAPDPKASIRAEVKRLLGTAGVEQAWQLDAGLASILALGTQQGLSEPQIYAINPGYRQIKDLRALVAIQEALL